MSTKLDTEIPIGYNAPDEVEARLDAACREADVTGTQKEILLLFLLDGLTPRQIRLKLHGDVRLSEVQRELAIGLKRLSGLPGFWDAAHEFPRQLVFCAADLRVYDERPPGVSGVEPDRASDQVHSGRMIAGDDRRLRQDLPSAARLWARTLRGGCRGT